jgi:DNA-binding FadR family transcriptional regulator
MNCNTFALSVRELVMETHSATSGRVSGAILKRLKHAIEIGIYANGDQLPAERQLALTFGAARATVRKVLEQLEEMKLVTRRAGSGTFVSYLGSSSQDLKDVAARVSPLQLIEMRFAIEPYMTWLATIHATHADLEDMGRAIRQLHDCNRDQDLFTQIDCEFHLALARCSRNPLIVRTYQQVNMVRLHAQWDRKKKLILTSDKILIYNLEHQRICDALLRRDAGTAVDLIKKHLEHARHDLIGADSA